MSLIEDAVLDMVDGHAEFENKMRKLTTWQRFLVIMSIYGWPMSAIAERAELSPQAVTHQFRKARKTLEI